MWKKRGWAFTVVLDFLERSIGGSTSYMRVESRTRADGFRVFQRLLGD